MNVRIEIDTKTFVRFWLVVIGFALVGYAIYSARTALIIIGISFFIAIALSGPVNRLVKILPGKSRVLSTAIAYVAVLLFLGFVIFLVIPPIVDQTAKFIQNIPNLLDSVSEQSVSVSKFIENNNLQSGVDEIINSIKDSTTRVASGIGSALIFSIGSVISVIVSLIFIIVLTFLMLVEGPTWLNRLWSVYTNKKRMEHHRKIIGSMYNVVTNYITGQLTVSAIAGIVAGIAVCILSIMFHVPMNLAISSAVMVFVSSLIPMFGALIGGAFVSIILLLNNVTAAIIFLVFFILYQQVEGNYISPHIQSKHVDLSALAILVAVSIGVYVFGIAGGIISIPIAGCIKVLVDDYLGNGSFKMINNKNNKSK